jgi:tetratricopeptide (TPR) repeat protein/SAM-dependent methyltransferase
MFAKRAAASVARRIVPRAGRRTAALLLAGARPFGLSDRVSRVLLREAGRRHDAGEPARSHQLVSALLRRPPQQASTALGIARQLRRSGEPAHAAELASAVLARPDLSDRDRAQALVQLAWAQERAGDLPTALGNLVAAVAAAPEQHTWRRSLAGWHYRLGGEHEKGRRWEPAAAAYQAAIDHDGDRAWWRYRLGFVLEKAEQWEPAAAAYEQAIARDSSHPGWHERLAYVAAKAPHWTMAKAPASLPVEGVVAPPARRAFTGWVPAGGGGGKVLFKLNGTVIADTLAAKEVTFAGHRYLEFRRNLQDVFSYAGAGDVLEVVYAGRPLHIIDSGPGFGFTKPESRVGELFAALEDGHVFNKYGRLRPSIQEDQEWQSMMFELFFQLRKELDEQFDLQLFPFYGTMLGAVREKNFIGHDNDFDTVYISKHSSPAAVREEFRAICDFLVDRGYSLRVKKTHTWVRVPGTGRELDKTYMHKLDIFFAWFDEDGYFQTSYGHHGEAIRRAPEFFEFRSEQLGIREIPVPRNAEDILAQLYGPGWRQPDPGFTHFSRTRIMRTEFHLGLSDANEAHWRQFYREHGVDGASSFAQFVAGRLPESCRLLDIGCGSGRDALYFARRGHRVIGLDRSAEGVSRGRDAGVAGARFEQLDVSSRDELTGFLSSLDAEESVVYLRFFLHSVEESTEDTVIGALLETLRPFRLCAEFRTVQDGNLPKVYSDHYRRYLDEQRFAEKLRDLGFKIEHLEAGRGLSPYEGEDPHLARIIAWVE